ncbi:hypothetical protein E2C01_024927 [Portunus trituberculatus]|uniref:Uncharacterized protein n=1 Tax=Portunus trituberculatus TaxID=210409 RepID=A0A5B7EF77_PORTR|nr:hypothetical protein [Portunus trituberculatus]
MPSKHAKLLKFPQNMPNCLKMPLKNPKLS